MTVVTRFAPSPTGFLHIGGARTALFNYLYSKNKGGKYLLRIEDTDTKRSTQEAIDAIIKGLAWLGLKHDGDIVFQSKNLERHKQVAHELLAKGSAYKCFSTTEELDVMRKAAEAEGKAFKYPRIWREKKESEAPAGAKYVIRIKAPLEGEIVVNDLIRGEVKYPANDLDDMVLLRADGTPTYMLAVVVDDHDMKVTNIIRGEDHLTNTFRQKMIYQAMGWEMPVTAHVPLIHGADGAKLSKRHGAQGVEEYQTMGYLPEAVNNYLMSLGWHWGDEETITMDEAIKRFDIKDVGKSPARFDFAKLNHINGIYMRKQSAQKTYEEVEPLLKEKYGERFTSNAQETMKILTPAVSARTQNYLEFVSSATTTSVVVFTTMLIEPKAEKALEQGKEHIAPLTSIIENTANWNVEEIKKALDNYGTINNLKPGQYLPALRAKVSKTMETPNLPDYIYALGKNEVFKKNERSMTDITPLIPASKKIIESYGNGAFKVSGEKYGHNLIIMPEALHKFESDNIETVSETQLKPVIENADNIEVLLVGCGAKTQFFPAEVETALNRRNIAVEYMDTGAAARTYNILLSEERKVAVVLIAV